MAIGRLSEAADAFAATLRLDPRRADAHDKLGLVYTEQSHVPLGAAMVDQDKLAAAVKEHRKAVALAPDNGWFQHNLGMAYERQRNYEEAATQYRKTLTVDPDLAYTRYRLGMIYSRNRKYEEAVGQLQAGN